MGSYKSMNDHLNSINELFKLVGPLGDLSGVIKKSQHTCDLSQKKLIINTRPLKNDKFEWFNGFCKKSQNLQQLFTSCMDDLDSIHSTCQAQNEEFKRIQDKYNLLSHNISQLQDLISGFERHYEHYRRYNVLNRILDGLESESHKSRQLFSESHLKDITLQPSSRITVDPITNEIDKLEDVIQGESSEFIDAASEIGGELAKIISSSHDSIEFFTLHPNYIQSDIYKSQYIDLRSRVFNLSIKLFKEVYSKIEFNFTSDLILDVSRHFLQCRVYASKLRSILDVLIEKTKLGDIVYENHLDQLQLYYVAMRIKNLHSIYETYLSEKYKLYKSFQIEFFQESLEFTINLSNLEISLFSTTFYNSGFQRLRSIIYSLSLSFTDTFKPILENMIEASVISIAIDLFQSKVPNNLINSDAFDPLCKAFEALERLLKYKFSSYIDNEINPLLDYKYDKSRFNICDPFIIVKVVDKISENITRLELHYSIGRLKEVMRLVLDVGALLSDPMDKNLFIIKNLHYIKDNIPIDGILYNLDLETVLDDAIFALCLDFADRFMTESNKLLNKLQNEKVERKDISESNLNLKSCLKKQLPVLYDRITRILSSNYHTKCQTMIMRINEVYFAIVTHISDLQCMIQELLPDGLSVLTPQQIKNIAKEYSIFE